MMRANHQGLGNELIAPQDDQGAAPTFAAANGLAAHRAIFDYGGFGHYEHTIHCTIYLSCLPPRRGLTLNVARRTPVSRGGRARAAVRLWPSRRPSRSRKTSFQMTCLSRSRPPTIGAAWNRAQSAAHRFPSAAGRKASSAPSMTPEGRQAPVAMRETSRRSSAGSARWHCARDWRLWPLLMFLLERHVARAGA